MSVPVNPDDPTLTLGDTVLDSTPPVGGPSRSAGSRADGEASGFDDYEVIEEIARGGMGVVYKARQKSLNRIVAIKMILSGDHASDAQVLRFRAEAEAVANLQHPNIVAIFAWVRRRGATVLPWNLSRAAVWAILSRRLCRPPKTPRTGCAKLLPRFHYAHERDIIHRDLKPHNILIDQKGQPRVTDFGLAKRLESESNLTVTAPSWARPPICLPNRSTVTAPM